MRTLIIISLLITQSLLAQAQSQLSGVWQGVELRSGHKIKDGTVFYAEFKVDNDQLSGFTREEIYDSDKFAVKRIDGSVKDNSLEFRQIVISKSSKSSRIKWCRIKGSLTYNKETGYLTGNYESIDCKRVIGKLILYKADFELAKGQDPKTSHLWYETFIKDYELGLSAPEIRKIERENFVFEPIFFDFDKAEIRDTHREFLNGLIKVVKGHSDLRVRVVGHTDSDGSIGYNDVLSKRRAEAIIQFFTSKGVSTDKLEFEYRGEKDPAATNKTSEGKQRNRRVDFEFI